MAITSGSLPTTSSLTRALDTRSLPRLFANIVGLVGPKDTIADTSHIRVDGVEPLHVTQTTFGKRLLAEDGCSQSREWATQLRVTDDEVPLAP